MFWWLSKHPSLLILPTVVSSVNFHLSCFVFQSIQFKDNPLQTCTVVFCVKQQFVRTQTLPITKVYVVNVLASFVHLTVITNKEQTPPVSSQLLGKAAGLPFSVLCTVSSPTIPALLSLPATVKKEKM